MGSGKHSSNIGKLADGSIVIFVDDQVLTFPDMAQFDEFWGDLWKQRQSYIKGDSLFDGPHPASIAGDMIEFLDEAFTHKLSEGEDADLLGTFVNGVVCGTSSLEEMPEEVEGTQQMKLAICEFLDSTDWSVEWIDEVFRTGIRGNNGRWRVGGVASESDHVFLFVSSRLLRIPQQKFPEIIEYINMVNSAITYGNFELNLSDGEIRYRTSIDVGGDRLTKSLVRQIVSGNLGLMDYYLPGFDWLIYGGFSANETLETIHSHPMDNTQHPMSVTSVNLVNRFLAKSGSNLEVCFGGSGKLKVLNLPDENLYNPFPGKTDGRMYQSYITHADPESIEDVLTKENIEGYSIGEIMEGIMWLHSRRLAPSDV
jgi:hypothetical protein